MNIMFEIVAGDVHMSLMTVATVIVRPVSLEGYFTACTFEADSCKSIIEAILLGKVPILHCSSKRAYSVIA